MTRVKIIDDDGNDIGAVERSYLVPLGLRHQIARVLVCHRTTREVLLQQRSFKKDSCPGMWDTSASGHVDEGETSARAAVRELEEEIGIKANEAELHKIDTTYTKESLADGILARETIVYMLSVDDKEQNVHIQKSELEKVAWLPIDAVLSDKDIELTPGARHALQAVAHRV